MNLARVIEFPTNKNEQLITSINDMFIKSVSSKNNKYVKNVCNFFNVDSLDKITVSQISEIKKQTVVEYMENFAGKSKGYTGQITASIKKYFEVALEIQEELGMNIIGSNPVNSIALKSFLKQNTSTGIATNEIRVIELDFMDKLLSKIESSDVSGLEKERDMIAVNIMCRTGMRREEFINLQVGDVSRLRGKYFVNVIEGKGNKSRPVDISEALYNEMMAYVEKYNLRLEDTFFFNLRNFKSITDPSSVNAMIKKYDNEVSPHDTRRFFITKNYASGVDINVIKELAGHDDVKTTAKYINRSLLLTQDRNML